MYSPPLPRSERWLCERSVLLPMSTKREPYWRGLRMTLTMQLPLPVSFVFVFYTLGQYWFSYLKPEGRISAFRTSIKKLAHQIVVSRFGLKKGCADQVEELLKSHKYIFPTDSNVSASSWCRMSFLIFMSRPGQGPWRPTILRRGHCRYPSSVNVRWWELDRSSVTWRFCVGLRWQWWAGAPCGYGCIGCNYRRFLGVFILDWQC